MLTPTLTPHSPHEPRYCAQYALDECADDLHYFEHEFPSGEKGVCVCVSYLDHACLTRPSDLRRRAHAIHTPFTLRVR